MRPPPSIHGDIASLLDMIEPGLGNHALVDRLTARKAEKADLRRPAAPFQRT